jgi:hypothetical protein
MKLAMNWNPMTTHLTMMSWSCESTLELDDNDTWIEECDIDMMNFFAKCRRLIAFDFRYQIET